MRHVNWPTRRKPRRPRIETSCGHPSPFRREQRVARGTVRPAVKVAIVVGGYLLAFLLASAAVAIHAMALGESGSQPSGGMSAFGDLVLFVAIFGAVSLAPTAAALYFVFSKRNRSIPAPERPPPDGTDRR
jgi:hypothetical protein